MAGKSYVFDIQRTMREAYDKARRRLHNSAPNSGSTAYSGTSDESPSPTHKSSRVDVADDAESLPMLPSNNGHYGDCLSTCTCFLVCESLLYFE